MSSLSPRPVHRQNATAIDLSGLPPATPPPSDLLQPDYYLNRELTWLEFNRRVLHEAMDPRTPLLERLKFMSIFSSNLDEFFMVRVAGLKKQVEAQVSKLTPDGLTPQDQLDEISQRLRPMVVEQHEHCEQVLRSLLKQHQIHILSYTDLDPSQITYLKNYFDHEIFPVLTPLAVDPGHPFPYISNLSLNLAVVMRDPEHESDRFARLKLPSPRFVQLPRDLWNHIGTGTSTPTTKAMWVGVPLEEVVAHNLETLFRGMSVKEYCVFRITRNADIAVEEDEADDLMLAIEQELRKRRLGGSAVRMEIQTSAPALVRETLTTELNLTSNDVYELSGLLNLRDMMAFMAIPLPKLKDPPWTPVVPPPFQALEQEDLPEALREGESWEDIFSLIRQHDLMIHHPYYSFSATIQRFITQSAHDPKVLAIKMTLYRTSGDSPIIQALIAAAENGKQVVALVELKARFDEANNILWARKLEQAGVHVVYGLLGLKTHTKVVLVVRREEEGLRRYLHIGTGNYNPKTAKLYTDLGLLSCRQELGADLSELFNSLTGYSKQRHYRKLLVAPMNLRDRMAALIQREIDHVKAGESAHIIAKMNSLVDQALIAKLYEASQAGVKIDLIVRGICCLRPGMPGISENIRVISVVGRYLEHSRIFWFHNNGASECFIGSADWMPRNLDRRVEAVAPIEDRAIAQQLQDLLTLMLNDNRQAWELHSDGRYEQRRAKKGEEECNTQVILMEQALEAVAKG
ncbi:MAG: polyphosphate kinase 1 [Leptolyngbyaceae bacterium]|nr:polyphosphate kinase 1 [Leptolyngbyaceae bacterium]